MIVFIRSSSVSEEVVEIWQPMVPRIKMAEAAFLRFVYVGKIIEIKTIFFRRRPKVRALEWESCGARSGIGGSTGS